MSQKLIKTYRADWLGNKQRAKEETKLFEQGYTIESEEEFVERDWGSTCCLAIIFLPLVFFMGKIKKVKVTYCK
jgi:hypothetical protein